MNDLLTLDYSGVRNVTLATIDLYEDYIQLAKKNAEEYKFHNTQFIRNNAWDLGITEEYDIITSNGLNI